MATSSGPTANCGHPLCDWQGQYFPNQHEIGLQIHDWNTQTDITAEGHWQSFCSIVFYVDGEPVPEGLRKCIKERPHWIWYKMSTNKAKYKGFHALCTACGAVMRCAYTPQSSRGWRDHQRANLLSWCGLKVPWKYTRPLEQELPMV